ncbi:MAG: hypothetical protein PHU78_09010, partial [Heliobacteriaceae bacterium]|nr:hypothetical protein [Heliobacteriaceae bacterium]
MKKIIVFLFICLLPVIFTGCTGNKPAEEPSVNPPTEENQVEVTLYYPNEEFIKTGNEKLDQLIPVKKLITVKENQTL